MCYVGNIDVYFLVLISQFVGAVNNALHVINLILYINVFFCWVDPVFSVDEER